MVCLLQDVIFLVFLSCSCHSCLDGWNVKRNTRELIKYILINCTKLKPILRAVRTILWSWFLKKCFVSLKKITIEFPKKVKCRFVLLVFTLYYCLYWPAFRNSQVCGRRLLFATISHNQPPITDRYTRITLLAQPSKQTKMYGFFLLLGFKDLTHHLKNTQLPPVI